MVTVFHKKLPAAPNPGRRSQPPRGTGPTFINVALFLSSLPEYQFKALDQSTLHLDREGCP